MQYKKIIIDADLKNQNIYLFLKSNGYSENYINNLRKDICNIKVNNEFTTVKHKLQNNDILEININPNTSTSIARCDMPLDIVFEDEYILVVNKPSGISCMPNKSHYNFNLAGAIVFYMQQKDPNFVLRILNRLDKDTQGLILIAKNALIYKDLQNSISKKYHSIVCGQIDRELTINKNIDELKDEHGRIIIKRVIAENQSGKKAITYVKPVQIFESHTLCEITLEHGRTHQIRVHLSSEGYPLLGDYIYGSQSNIINHTCLICKQIEFTHPVNYKKIILSADYEQNFLNALKTIRE